jgi:hypothetical protein
MIIAFLDGVHNLRINIDHFNIRNPYFLIKIDKPINIVFVIKYVR